MQTVKKTPQKEAFCTSQRIPLTVKMQQTQLLQRPRKACCFSFPVKHHIFKVPARQSKMNLLSKFLIPSYRTCGWNKEERAASVNDIIITAKWSLSRLQGNIGGVAALIAYMTSRSIDFLKFARQVWRYILSKAGPGLYILFRKSLGMNASSCRITRITPFLCLNTQNGNYVNDGA